MFVPSKDFTLIMMYGNVKGEMFLWILYCISLKKWCTWTSLSIHMRMIRLSIPWSLVRNSNFIYSTKIRSWPGGSSCKALGYEPGGSGSIPSVGGMAIFPHSFVARLVFGSTQHPIKWVSGISPGIKAAKRKTSHRTSFKCSGCEYLDTCIHIPHGPSWSTTGITLPFTKIRRERNVGNLL